MVMVLFVYTAVSIARIKSAPLIVRGQTSVGSRKRIVENGSRSEECNRTH